MKNSVTIDFETANHHCTNEYSAGVVIVYDSKVKDKFYRLIKSYPNDDSGQATESHELQAQDTADAQRSFTEFSKRHRTFADAETYAKIALNIF